MRFSIAFTLVIITSCYGSRTNQVSRAIENTKRRQTPAVQQIRSTQQQRPGRTEDLDVDKLNKLIRTIDKTWVLPRPGAKEPVGSNFQYKKTCASIYKVRHGACQQIGFGVMCFNYCHEQGQKLSFRCQDTSDASYCRSIGTFDTTLAKYRKDSYKAKTFIHQMISRCYATAICNLQTGLLNSTLVEEEYENALVGPKPPSRVLKQKTSTSSPKLSTQLKSKPRALNRNKISAEVSTVTQKPSKINIWDRFTVNQKAKPTAKYIPFWQKLLLTTTVSPSTTTSSTTTTTTTTTTTVTLTSEETMNTELPDDKEDEDGETELEPEDEETEDTETAVEPTTNEIDEHEEESGESTEEKQAAITPEQKTTTIATTVTATTKLRTTKRMAKPKQGVDSTPISLPSILERKSMQKPKNEKGPEFWNRFQPGKWFQSVHYVTNTGR